MKIFFVTALYYEAKPIIMRYSLKRVALSSRFEIYEDETAQVILVITGVGKENALSAVGYVFGKYADETPVQVIQLGVCGATQVQKGEIFQCIQVKSASGGRDLYPEYQSGLALPCHRLVTADTIVEDKAELPQGDYLVDMEGYGAVYSAFAFCASHQVVVIKAVSDELGDAKTVTPLEVEALACRCVEAVAPWLEGLQEQYRMQEEQSVATSISETDMDALSHHFCASTAMELELRQALRYACGVNPPKTQLWVEERLQQEPTGNRVQGKQALAQAIEELRAMPWAEEGFYVDTLENTTRGIAVVYVEEAVASHPRTRRWLAQLPGAVVIPIRHYKDIFNRLGKQNSGWQKKHPCLVIAQKTGELVYAGAAMCHDFGSSHFCYTSCVMNCIYDCQYCYLQGMYPSGHLVAFVNLEDIWEEAVQKAGDEEMYLSVSFDTDLLALEGLLGLCREWADFAKKHPHILVELRTKGGAERFLKPYQSKELTDIPSNLVLSWSVSPEKIVSNCEHKTASLRQRMMGAKQAMQLGFRVRLCFDPMIYVPGWQEMYQELLVWVRETLGDVTGYEALDVSIGVFRIGQDYLKRMRRNRSHAPLVQFPYTSVAGHAQYEPELAEEMVQWMTKMLEKELGLSESQIFLLKE